MTAVRMWCLRHAESENVTAALAGALPNAPLTAHGHHQALRAAQTLADEPISNVYSSTALRSRQTAHAPLPSSAPGSSTAASTSGSPTARPATTSSAGRRPPFSASPNITKARRSPSSATSPA